MSTSVRAASSDDYDAFCALVVQADKHHAAGLPRLFREASGPARPRAVYDEILASPEKTLLAAELEGRVVGLVSVELRSPPEYPILVPRRFGYVEDLVVDAEARRRGVGRALMAAAEAWIVSQGGSECRLNVYSFNAAALALYEELGYEPLSVQLSKAM